MATGQAARVTSGENWLWNLSGMFVLTQGVRRYFQSKIMSYFLNNKLYSELSMITCRVRLEIICGGWLLLDSVLVLATASTFLVCVIPQT